MEFSSNPYNFSRSTYEKEGRIYKFKPIGFEKAFLDHESPLRKLFKKLKIELPFPVLDFDEISEYEFSVTKIEIEKLSENSLDEAAFKKIGGVLGILGFFGISDLHKENLLVGLDKKTGEFLFCPIDFESILDSYIYLSQTKLLPTKDLTSKDCGLSNLYTYIKDFEAYKHLGACIRSYVDTIELLKKNYKNVNKAFKKSGLFKEKIRVFIRPTDDYKSYLEDEKFEVYEQEKIQLERGDIPYFYRKQDDFENIYYYTTDKFDVGSFSVPSDCDSFFMAYDTKDGIKLGGLDKLSLNGSLQLLRYLLQNVKELDLDFEEIKIKKTGDDLELIIDGKSLNAKGRPRFY